jgi:Protein of unknown function (DUF1499)
MKPFSLATSTLILLTASAEAYQLSPVSTTFTTGSRRELLRSLVGVTAFACTVTATSLPADAIEACPNGSNNCIRTAWTPPAGTSKSNAAKQLKAILESYPQEGQDKVDLGGWSFASDSLESSGTASLEYKSGIGNFAKYFNGGKPFVDDLVIEVGEDGKTQVRSSSRVGDSDFKVNQKRLTFFAKKLNDAGWTAPEPKY